MDRDQLLGLLLKLLFIPLEVFEFVGDFGSLYLFVRQLLELLHALYHVFFAEVDQTQVLLEVFLFAVNAHFLYLERIRVLELGLGFLELYFLDDLVEVTLDLPHGLDFAHFYFFSEREARLDEDVGLVGHHLETGNDFVAIFLQDVN